MSVHDRIDILASLVCSVYCTIPLFWLVVHPLVHRWRTLGRRAYWLLLPAWAAFIAAAFAITFHFRHLHLYRNWAAWIPGVLFILLGMAIYRASFQGFDRNMLSGIAELTPLLDQQLAVGGIRSKVRHPIYLGHFCEVFGCCLGTGSIALLGLLGFAVITGAGMIRMEDNELEERFGERYRQYRRRVSAFLP